MTYIVIMTERVNRAIVALLGAGLMILAGVLTQEAAIRGVDFNTLGPLVGHDGDRRQSPAKSGVFQYRGRSGRRKKVKRRPWGILVTLRS